MSPGELEELETLLWRYLVEESTRTTESAVRAVRQHVRSLITRQRPTRRPGASPLPRGD